LQPVGRRNSDNVNTNTLLRERDIIARRIDH
jgi:hypothetical protein